MTSTSEGSSLNKTEKHNIADFDVLLTANLSIILASNQLDAQILVL